MDGRLLVTGVILSSMAAALGCRSTQNAGFNSTPNALERAFAPKPPIPGRPVEVVDANEPKGPLKSETVAVLAELQVDAAFNNEELSVAERDRRLDEARTKFQMAIEQDPKNLEAHRGLGRLYVRLNDKERAAASYQTALTHHPKNHTLCHEAALAFGRFDDWQTALTLWEHALSLDPANRKYPRMIGIAQARLGNFEAGFAAMLKGGIGEAEARSVMARELFDAGQADAGRTQLELALKADPNCALAQQLQTHANGIQPVAFR